jgi:hypothetical protein
MVAEAASAKYKTLHSRGRIFNSKDILGLMARLEEELGGTADDLFPQCAPHRPTDLRSRKSTQQLASSRQALVSGGGSRG